MKTTGIEVKKFRLKDLEGAAYNPRTISETAFRGLRDSLTAFGMLEAPVVNVKDGRKRIVSGHQRVQAMIEQGVEFADCVVVSFDDTAEKVANITLNNPAIRGAFDPLAAMPVLERIEKDLPVPDFARYDALIADLREKAERSAVGSGKAAEETAAEEPQEKTRSRVGKVYGLGRHRLYCGPYTEGVARLFRSRKADVAFVGHLPDPRDGSEDEDSLKTLFDTLLRRVRGPSFVFADTVEISDLSRVWSDAGGVLVRWLFWIADRAAAQRHDYRTQHEACLFGTLSRVDLGDAGATATNVFEAPRVAASARVHPKQKPVDLVRQMLASVASEGDIIFDPYACAGTTIVVAEESGFTCLACESDPDYVDVIRKRWAEQAHGAGCDWARETRPLKA